jgi:hypothetical protein
MDGEKLNQAISRLVNFENSLPQDDEIEEKYVDLYHKTLSDIQDETGFDLSYFVIPPTELKHREFQYPGTPAIGHHPGSQARTEYSPMRYCDRARFLIELRGAITSLNRISEGASRRVIGYV